MGDILRDSVVNGFIGTVGATAAFIIWGIVRRCL